MLRNTGWPVGVVIERDGLKPIPVSNGIEARLTREDGLGHDDFWSLMRNGTFYFLRPFEEDDHEPNFTSSLGHPDRAMWFDVRIWRISELILHSATLYNKLGISPEEPYLLLINHLGLQGRELYTSNARRHVFRGSFSKVDQTSWSREVTQDLVNANLKALVAEASNQLFVMFDFHELEVTTIDAIVDEFLRSKL